MPLICYWIITLKKGFVRNGLPNISKTIFRSIIDPSTFKNLNPKNLTNSSSGNSISGGFINTNANKFNVTEPNLKAQFDDIVANGDQLGTKTEDLLKEIIEDGETSGFSHFDGTYGSNNGFDGVFINNETGEVIINKSKQWTGGSISLTGANPNTALPAQMTDEWIDFVIENLYDTDNPLKIITANSIIQAKAMGKLIKIVTVVDRTTTGNANNLIGEVQYYKS